MSKKNGGQPEEMASEPIPLTFYSGPRHVDLHVKLYPEGDRWNAECLELGTAQFGSTEDEAFELVVGAISLHLETLDEVGELERFCEDNGIEIYEPPEHRWALSQRDKIAV